MLVPELPAECWDHIMDFCDFSTHHRLSKVNHSFERMVSHHRATMTEKMLKKSVVVPSKEILAMCFRDDEFPIEMMDLAYHNPFGRNLVGHASKVEGVDVIEGNGPNNTHYVTIKRPDFCDRGRIEFVVDYEKLCIPKWIIDGLRPTVHVSAVMQRSEPAKMHGKTSAMITLYREGKNSKKTMCCACATLDPFVVDTIIERSIEGFALKKGYQCVAGSDRLIVTINTSCHVDISDVQIYLRLPDKIPELFDEWLEEGRQIRKTIIEKRISPTSEDVIRQCSMLLGELVGY